MSILEVVWKTFQYPPTQRVADIGYYKSAVHGQIAVANPYSWLESDSTERDAWVDAQNQFTGDYLDRYTDRNKLTVVIERSFNYTIFDPPRFGAQERWYWMAQTGTQEQPVLYRSEGAELPFTGDDGKDDLEANAEIYFDVNLLSSDFLSLSTWAFSPNDAYFAYSVSRCESDIQEIYIRRASHPFNKDYPEHEVTDYIRHSAFGSVVWDNSSNGIFYVHEPSDYSGGPSSNAKLLYHRLGTEEEDDLTILVGEDANAMFSVSKSSDGKYLLLSITKGIKDCNMLWIAEIASVENGDVVTWIKLKDRLEATYEYISNDGPTFYFFTNEGSDRYHVVKVHVNSSSDLEHRLVPIISDARNVFLRQYKVISSRLAVSVYSHNVKDELYILLEGKAPERLEADFIGTITVHPINNGFLANFVSYTTPGYVKRFVLGDNSTSWELWRNTHFDALPLSEFVTQQVWYNSTDGTQVPMFIVRHESTVLDGTAPCLQYAYGAFGVSVTPFFSPSFLAFMHVYGGVLAVPSVRGGSEFGTTWKNAGSKRNKSNTIADFIAASEFLVREKYAAPEKVAIIGWSGGGELMGESVQRAPEGTFGAVVVNRGAHDLLRFSLFPPGKYWISDVGDPFEPEDFDFIFPISPQHNVPANKALPPTLVTAGQRDRRVLPLFSYKYAATLQYMADPRSAVQLFLTIKNAGHAEDSSSHTIRVQEAVLTIGFVAQSLALHLK